MINIREGLGASQYGIGAVIARLAEAVLRHEGHVLRRSVRGKRSS
jgi:malate/lactate dehydrogenase